MTELPPEFEAILTSIIMKVRDCVHISKVYLFGSYYNGSYNEDSDLDIAFFVKNDESLFDVNRKILKITSKYPIDIQPQIFFESELEDRIGIVEEILDNGREIHLEDIIK